MPLSSKARMRKAQVMKRNNEKDESKMSVYECLSCSFSNKSLSVISRSSIFQPAGAFFGGGGGGFAFEGISCRVTHLSRINMGYRTRKTQIQDAKYHLPFWGYCMSIGMLSPVLPLAVDVSSEHLQSRWPSMQKNSMSSA